jgi:hypothetical protein
MRREILDMWPVSYSMNNRSVPFHGNVFHYPQLHSGETLQKRGRLSSLKGKTSANCRLLTRDSGSLEAHCMRVTQAHIPQHTCLEQAVISPNQQSTGIGALLTPAETLLSLSTKIYVPTVRSFLGHIRLRSRMRLLRIRQFCLNELASQGTGERRVCGLDLGLQNFRLEGDL